LNNKIIIVTAPSGSGKTTLVKNLLSVREDLEFSISATTRKPRMGETNGKDYYFISVDQFQNHIEKGEFVEWEMVYNGKYYGTLQEELQRIWHSKKTPLIDIDVKGAMTIKSRFPEQSLTIFIKAPSLEEIRKRLIARSSETPESLSERLSKAEEEMGFSNQFDEVVLNDNLEKAMEGFEKIVSDFLD